MMTRSLPGKSWSAGNGFWNAKIKTKIRKKSKRILKRQTGISMKRSISNTPRPQHKRRRIRLTLKQKNRKSKSVSKLNQTNHVTHCMFVMYSINPCTWILIIIWYSTSCSTQCGGTFYRANSTVFTLHILDRITSVYGAHFRTNYECLWCTF